jgi:hypothetical protein
MREARRVAISLEDITRRAGACFGPRRLFNIELLNCHDMSCLQSLMAIAIFYVWNSACVMFIGANRIDCVCEVSNKYSGKAEKIKQDIAKWPA